MKKSYSDLIVEMESLKGFRIINDIELLKGTNYTLHNNYVELKNMMEKYEQDIEIQFLKNRPQLYFFLLEFTRLLHNYSASVKTLVDHTRNFKNKIEDNNFQNTYEEKLTKLNNNDVVGFMQKLRNYVQHYKLPIIKTNLSINGNIFEAKIILDKNELLKWKKWGSNSKKYIGEFDEGIEIIPLCEEYYNLIHEFYIFFYNEVLKAYNTEIIDFQEFQKNILKLYPPLNKK